MAVIINIINAKVCPIYEYVNNERNIKFKTKEKNINSEQINIIKKFCLFQIIPTNPTKNKKKLIFKKNTKGINLPSKLNIKMNI